MRYQVICVGKIKESYYREEIAEIREALRRKNIHLDIVELRDYAIPKRLSEQAEERFLEKECEEMHAKIGKRDYVVALCVEGKEMTTKQHAAYIRSAEDKGYETVTYVIGGSLGIATSVKKRADLCMSFSKMTFPHQMMRMILCEELLRVAM